MKKILQEFLDALSFEKNLSKTKGFFYRLEAIHERTGIGFQNTRRARWKGQEDGRRRHMRPRRCIAGDDLASSTHQVTRHAQQDIETASTTDRSCGICRSHSQKCVANRPTTGATERRFERVHRVHDGHSQRQGNQCARPRPRTDDRESGPPEKSRKGLPASRRQPTPINRTASSKPTNRRRWCSATSNPQKNWTDSDHHLEDPKELDEAFAEKARGQGHQKGQYKIGRLSKCKVEHKEPTSKPPSKKPRLLELLNQDCASVIGKLPPSLKKHCGLDARWVPPPLSFEDDDDVVTVG